MSLTPEEEAAGGRLDLYNGRAYHPVTDPYAFDRGGNQAGVFVQMLRDVAAWGRGVLRVSAQLLADTRASGAQHVGDAREAARLAAEDAANTEADRTATGQDRLAAAGSAGQAAASAARFQGTSTTSRTPAIGALTFTTEGGKAFDVGTWLTVQSRGTAGRWAYGKVTAYAGTSVTIAVESIGPTVSAGTDWNLLVGGARGAVGPESWGQPTAWAPTTNYQTAAPRSIVVYEGESYACIVAHQSAAAFNAANWIKVAAKATTADAVNRSAAYALAFGGL